MKNTRDKTNFPFVGFGPAFVADQPGFVQMKGENASMALFAARLSREVERPVLERTGLTGAFDFSFKFVRSTSESTEGPSLFSAIQQLGLKLVSTKAPIMNLVIDHAARPSEN